MNLNGKVAVVTGAANGIGAKIVQVFREYGAEAIGIDMKWNGTCDQDAITLDIRDTEACEEVYQELVSRFGHIDILVNCAGITRDAMTKKMTEQQFDEVLDVNLKGVWNLTKLIGPHMMEQKCGSVINISSVVGIYGNVGQSNYAATKAGVIGMTKSWAKEFGLKGGNVRVNAIAPGYTLTDMVKTVPEELLDQFAAQTMLGRLADPVEIANTALFLASDLSSYITGAVICVDGGMRL